MTGVDTAVSTDKSDCECPNGSFKPNVVPISNEASRSILRERIDDSVYTIIAQFQQEYRGLVEYYQLAVNCSQLKRLKGVMEQSLTKTLAHKLRISVPKVYKRYGTMLETPEGPRKGLQVVVERGGKKSPWLPAGEEFRWLDSQRSSSMTSFLSLGVNAQSWKNGSWLRRANCAVRTNRSRCTIFEH